MGFLKRLFGFPDRMDAEQLVNDMFSGKSEKRRQKSEKQANEDIAKAMSLNEIANTMSSSGLTEEHLYDLYRRISMDCDRVTAISAITDPEIIRWFGENGGKEMRLSFGQSVELVNYARNKL